MSNPEQGPVFDTRSEVDFVIIGSGAAGGVMAKELSSAGFDVVVLEQGSYRKASDFVSHDEFKVLMQNDLTAHPSWDDPQTFRHTEDEVATVQQAGIPPAFYARTVGGSSVHFTANYWRFHENDFMERSLLGEMPGTGFVDWPISYAELEPYYTKVEWECGVSGEQGPLDPPRSRPYPMPPMPVKSSGVLFEKGARAMGLHPQAAPLAILSQPHDVPAWGKECKQALRHYFTRKMAILSSTTSIPLESNNITLDPDLRDDMGRPVIRMTHRDHDDDMAMAIFLQDRAVEIMQAASASKVWRDPVAPGVGQAHLLGTCRMGNDPSSSVIDRFHRSHEVPNLFICDGSSFASSGRGQPTMTVQALAFRAADHIAEFARKGEI